MIEEGTSDGELTVGENDPKFPKSAIITWF